MVFFMSGGHPHLNKRQRVLLALVKALGGSVKRTDFQKLLFLYCKETRAEPPYEFVPYQYGAFSFTSYADWRKLVNMGLMSDDDSAWRLSKDAINLATRFVDLHIKSFANRYSHVRGNSLVALTYRQYPYYAVRSEILDQVLGADETAKRRISEERAKVRPRTLSTIGYEGRSFENYLNELLSAGVTVLCDVRSNAFSRKYGFAKSTLENSCKTLGIDYLHLPELGISSDRRQRLGSAADYSRLFAEYEQYDLPEQPDALRDIADLVLSGESVALTCFERDPEDCHRSRLAISIEKRYLNGQSTSHL